VFNNCVCPKLTILILAGLAVVGCQQQPPSANDNSATTDKIAFDLNQFDDDGLYGPPDGKRSLDYEFCIPDGDTYLEEVNAIDPSLEVFLGSAGRIGCTADQTLAIGNTHQDNFRLVLMELANLDYVERIQRVDWE
jgi:basic membrane lipoprotein Med (substrate-binding protein (PBP1-ABC) superfamily)